VTSLYALGADLILVLHFLVVLFVVGGQLMVMLGGWCRWDWVRNRGFRVLHLVLIVVVVSQAWLGQLCPLTLWEMELRTKAGQVTYGDSFISHWISRLLYYQAPAWVFTLCYSLFAALVFVSWIGVRPHPPTDRKDQYK
jgi:polyferredoxin